jgi:hypothetical protein
MITTLYFIILIAFQLWYLTSLKVKHLNPAGYVLHIRKSPREYRLVGGVLFLLATALFVMRMGWMSGISASLVGLMGVGSLVIMLAPFNYLRLYTVVSLYIVFFILEISL